MTEITKEQLAVIEAAKAWNEDYYVGRHNRNPETKMLLCEAVNALPEPYVPLMSRGELREICNTRSNDATTRVDDMRAASILTLRKASDRMEELEFAGGYGSPVARLREWADEEEKLNK